MKKTISVTVIIAGVVAMLCAVVPIFVSAVSEASSVGIIGGADGPTAIMVSGDLSTSGVIVAVIVGILLVATGILVLKKAKKKD